VNFASECELLSVYTNVLQSTDNVRYVNFEELFRQWFVILFDQYCWSDKIL